MSERYKTAKQRYQEYGVDVEAALDILKGHPHQRPLLARG